MGQYGTNYLESEAILAAQEGDEEEVRKILKKMLPNELRKLGKASNQLGYLIEECLRDDKALKEGSNAS